MTPTPNAGFPSCLWREQDGRTASPSPVCPDTATPAGSLVLPRAALPTRGHRSVCGSAPHAPPLHTLRIWVREGPSLHSVQTRVPASAVRLRLLPSPSGLPLCLRRSSGDFGGVRTRRPRPAPPCARPAGARVANVGLKAGNTFLLLHFHFQSCSGFPPHVSPQTSFCLYPPENSAKVFTAIPLNLPTGVGRVDTFPVLDLPTRPPVPAAAWWGVFGFLRVTYNRPILSAFNWVYT